jgi:ubiquinone biosynthesis protein
VTDAEAITGPSDLTWGSFSDTPPWVLDREQVTWWPLAQHLRRDAAMEVPRLIEPARVPPAPRMARVVGRLGWALGPWALRKRRGTYPDTSASRADISRRMRKAAEALGPTYIKLGQIISSGEGLFPAELVAEFKLCRDRVKPETFATVKRTVEADLGVPIAQVHAARLRTGEDVVVKVQRPQVSRLVHRDLRVMAWLAPHLVGRIPVTALANPPALVEVFAETIIEELDFRIEAANMLDVAVMLRAIEQRSYLVPRPHPTLVTKRVLVMERLDGFNFDDVAGMHGAGIDTENVVRVGMAAFMEGALIHGIFHGDLHGGNLFVRPDGRTALLDFGIIGRLSEPRRVAFLRLMLGATTNDPRTQITALRDLGALPSDVDIDEVMRELRLDQPVVDPTTLTGEQLVKEVQRVVKALLDYGARMPKELMLYVKNLVFLDGAIARLAPDLDIIGEIAQISVQFTQRHSAQINRDLGLDPSTLQVSAEGIKATFGVDPSIDRLTYRDLKKRRALIEKRMRDHARR